MRSLGAWLIEVEKEYRAFGGNARDIRKTLYYLIQLFDKGEAAQHAARKLYFTIYQPTDEF